MKIKKNSALLILAFFALSLTCTGCGSTGPALPAHIAANFEGRAAPDTKNWDIEALDTAGGDPRLTPLEKDVILEMNKVRANPRRYADLYIQPRLQFFEDKRYIAPGEPAVLTLEGAAAVHECIAALRNTPRRGLLMPEKGLSLAAKALAADQSRTGQTGHIGSDRSTTESRARRHGTFVSSFWILGENISYFYNTGRNIVCALLIDDGILNRGHRDNILNKDFTQTGVGIAAHPRQRMACIIKYANGYVSN
jgi:uncharacterized protein YkwD